MKEKIPGYTAYVRKKAEAAFDLNHQPIQDFFTAMQLFYKRINKQPRLIKASDLAQELEATASMSPEITTYPDDWILNDYNVADLIQLLELDLKDAGVKCFVLQKDQYITPDIARNKYIFFYTGDKYADYDVFIRTHQYKAPVY